MAIILDKTFDLIKKKIWFKRDLKTKDYLRSFHGITRPSDVVIALSPA